MNLFDGLFQRKSAFTQVNPNSKNEAEVRLSRVLENQNNLISNSTNNSSEVRNSQTISSERYSSSSERDFSMRSENTGSMDRKCFNPPSPLLSHNDDFTKPKAVKPSWTNKFNFLSRWNINSINSLHMNSSLYWMKYQMMLKPQNQMLKLSDDTSQKKNDFLLSSFESSNSEIWQPEEEKMVGKLTASERKQKVDRYLQK